MNRVLAAIHDVDLIATGLDDYGPEGNYYRRQIDRWTKQYRASEIDHIPAMEDLIAWLDANIPADDGQRTLVHGDYRIDNMLFAKDSATMSGGAGLGTVHHRPPLCRSGRRSDAMGHAAGQ
jgi:aminoglycoside phosphotransferase (APT) family kinase protein